MVDWYLVSVLIFAAFLALLVYLDRKNWKRESILLLRKTQKGKAFLIWLGNRFPRFWKAVGALAVVITLISSVWFIWVLFQSAGLILAGVIKSPGGILIPLPSNQTVSGPGFVGVPFWYWIISIAVLVVVHEGMHGVMAAREKVRIKSLGVGLLAVIPMAFVEPDEKQLQRQKSWKQLRVFSAGSFANYVTALIFILILSLSFSAAFAPRGVVFLNVTGGSPAFLANVTYPGVILSINNQTVEGRQGLADMLTEIGPNREIEIQALALDGNQTREVKYTLVTGEALDANGNPTGRGLIGIQNILDGNDLVNPFTSTQLFLAESDLSYLFMIRQDLAPFAGPIFFIFGLMSFLFLINFGVGLFNMLPIGPLDGGRMWNIIISRITPSHSKAIMRALTIATTTFVIVVIFVLPFL